MNMTREWGIGKRNTTSPPQTRTIGPREARCESFYRSELHRRQSHLALNPLGFVIEHMPRSNSRNQLSTSRENNAATMMMNARLAESSQLTVSGYLIWVYQRGEVHSKEKDVLQSCTNMYMVTAAVGSAGQGKSRGEQGGKEGGGGPS
jgi:hypothetical protein